jgi:hypothetical protein
MTISYSLSTDYEHSIGSTAADVVAAASTILSLSTRNINPINPGEFARKHDEADIPEADGARDLSDGKQQAVTINFRGEMSAQDPDDLFMDLMARLNTLAVTGSNTYLKSGYFDGSVKQYVRRYGKVLGASPSYVPKSQYSIVQLQMAFRVLDPCIYFDTPKTATGTFVSSTGGTIALTDTGIVRSARAIVTITATAAAASTTYNIKNNANQAFIMTGALPAIGDKWVIDLFNKTVTKWTTGGTVPADDIANFTGVFWGVKNASDTITVLAGAARSFTVKVDWLERRF